MTLSPQADVLFLMEIVLKVFGHLSARSLLRASQTCGIWRRIIGARPELWRMCFVRQHGQPKLSSRLYALSDYKRILMYKMFRERTAWQGLAKNKPRMLVKLPPEFAAPCEVQVSASALAYYRRLEDKPGTDATGRPAHDYLGIQSVSSSHHATFSLPLFHRTYTVDDDGPYEPYEMTEVAAESISDIQSSGRFVAVNTRSLVRVYPSAPHTRPFRVDIRHEAPFNQCGQMMLDNDVLVVAWLMCPMWRAEHEDELRPYANESQSLSVLRVYDLRKFRPAVATDRFTVFPHTVLPWREVFTPYTTYVHATFDFSQAAHFTDHLAQQHQQHVDAHPDRVPFLKVVTGNDATDGDESGPNPSGHRMIVFAFDQQLKVIGVRKYEHQVRPNSTLYHAAPRSQAWISIHGNMLLNLVKMRSFEPDWVQPRLSMHLDDSHSAPLPSPDAVDAITHPTIANWIRAVEAFRDIAFVAPNTIMRVPCCKLPHHINWLHMQGHHLLIKAQTRSHRVIKVFDVHTWELVSSHSLKTECWEYHDDGTMRLCEANLAVHSRLSERGVYLIRDIDNGKGYQLEHLPYRLQTPISPPPSPGLRTTTQLVQTLGGKPGLRRNRRWQRSRTTQDYHVDIHDNLDLDDDDDDGYDSDGAD
ncbi:hypothetical protein RI367_005919 [Sorochytrium milnesiophthora]